tara:strand:+ start:8815 stop:8964 length:150 start_codon:yes stop_codon:yes gene_type:complete
MILYTEKQLENCYKEYCLFQGKNNMGFVTLEDFRKLFENLFIKLGEDLK